MSHLESYCQIFKHRLQIETKSQLEVLVSICPLQKKSHQAKLISAANRAQILLIVIGVSVHPKGERDLLFFQLIICGYYRTNNLETMHSASAIANDCLCAFYNNPFGH